MTTGKTILPGGCLLGVQYPATTLRNLSDDPLYVGETLLSPNEGLSFALPCSVSCRCSTGNAGRVSLTWADPPSVAPGSSPLTIQSVQALIDASMPKPYTETPSGPVNGTNKVFALTYAPIRGSVGLDTDADLGDYTLDGQTLTFEFAPPTGSQIKAQYDYR